MPRPIPVADAISKPFWDACNERRLIIQRCTMCERNQHPPEATCRECGWQFHLEWQETSGRGTIVGYSITYDSRIMAWQEEQPFNNAVVALEEDPEINFFSNLPGVPVGEVPVGATVEVDFIEVSADQLIPEWKVVE